MWERFGLPCRGSALPSTRGACGIALACSGWGTETNTAGPVCCAGCCADFSSMSAGEGWASSEPFNLLFRGAGAALGSLGSTALRDFLGFFSSTTIVSFGFGFGPGFLRGWPAAVNLGVVVVELGVGVLVFATPTSTPGARGVTTRMAALFGSGE
jgi:hypothetical protein